MKRTLAVAVVALSVAAPTFTAPAFADDRYDRDHSYHGRDRSYYEHCKRSSGTTGLLAGGAGGALAGNLLGGGALGTIAGGVGGALLGRHLDKKHDAAQNRKNGC